MGDLTKNVSRYEVACNCGCGFDSIDFETLNVVQECCDHFANKLGVEKVILDINSGCRCEYWNGHEKGSRGSRHVDSRAIDFSIKGVLPSEVYKYLNDKYSNKYGIGKYTTFTHIDTRTGKPARW